MSNKPYILSVDDEELNQEIITELLKEHFEINVLNNGQQCLDSVLERIPDLILLDVNMPVLNGLETCEILRSNDSHQNIPIIFVSALASPKERLAGYQAGADDYLTKPFDEFELVNKINLLLKSKEERTAQQQEKQYATDTAMAAMSSAAETGIVLLFMRDILTINEQSLLEKRTFEALHTYGLDGCIMFSHLASPIFTFSDNIARPIEKDILREAFTKGRIIEFSGRAIFNSEHVAILIRRMPEDEEKNGRYKDHLASLVDALEAKLVEFIENNNKQKHYTALENTIESITTNLQQINHSYQQQRLLNTKILGELAQKVEASFLSLGLDDSQEGTMMQLIIDAEKETDHVYEQGKQAEQTFDKIVNDLNMLLK
ncbi:MAG: response regulator [Pseudomonadota bacterium]